MQDAAASLLLPVEGKYEILAKIREGGMGAVYRVRHRLLDEIRVIKVMRARHSGNAELRARFIAEARAAIRLRHPNVVEIHDFTLDQDGTGLIVMEHIDGIDLAALRLGGPPSLALLIEIARQGLRALAYLHRRGFVHRDISPDNLMLTTDAEGWPLVKLIDLGIAKDRHSGIDLTQTGVFLGKFRYASPEHFSAEDSSDIGPRSDLYALGVVLYELATGIHPIIGEDAAALIAGHLFRPPRGFAETDPGARLPKPLRAILERCLNKGADQRFASAQEMRQALAPLVEGHPVDEAVTRETVKRIRERPDTQPSAAAGSTQHRLDGSFDLVTTPLPAGRGRPSLESTVPASATLGDPDDPFDHFVARGCALAADGAFAGAAEAFTQALALRSESRPVRLLLAEAEAALARQQGDDDEP